MLLRLHGVPIGTTSQHPRQRGDAEPRSVVGRGLRRSADQRQPGIQRHQPFRRLAEQGPDGAVDMQSTADARLSTATDVDMTDADVAGSHGARSSIDAGVDVPGMTAAVTALLAEVCGDRGRDELQASAQRYVWLLIESTSGARLLQPAEASSSCATGCSSSSSVPARQPDQPQHFQIQFTSQVLTLATHVGPWLMFHQLHHPTA